MIKVTLKSGIVETFDDPTCYGGYIGWEIHKNGALSIGESNINSYSYRWIGSYPPGSWDFVKEVKPEAPQDNPPQASESPSDRR